jgi:hypothetical protein
MTLNGQASTDMVPWPQTASIVCQNLLAVCQAFSKLQPQMEHGLAQIGQQEPVSHYNNTQWTHMDDMKWSSINWYGAVTVNSLYSMSKFVGSVPSFWQAVSPKWSMAWHRLASRSLFHIITSLIGHTWMIWNGPASTDMVPWPQTASSTMSKFVGSVRSFCQAASPKCSMDWLRLASRSLFYITTSLIRHIWITW